MKLAAWFLAALLPVALPQMGQLSDAPRPASRSYITYAAEQQVIPAARKAALDLRFQVNPGFHVNSHTPKSELLIPTSLTLQPADGVKAGPLDYPKGQEYSFSFEPGEKLDVYSGAFTLKLPVEAAKGDHTLQGVLHYQACDNAACYPPKSLPVTVSFTAR